MNRLVPAPEGQSQEIADILAPYVSIALVLQGGGAVGDYQAGVFEALHDAGINANFLSGVSIGAINATIIAGNKPGNQLDRLRDFWETLTRRKVWTFTPEGDVFRRMRNQHSAMMTMMTGLPGFFCPTTGQPLDVDGGGQRRDQLLRHRGTR